MDAGFIQEQKQALTDEKHRLLEELNSIGRKSGNDEENFTPKFEDYGSEDGENAQELAEFETKASIEGELEDSLRDVDDALAKIDEGTYGVCEDCGREIPTDRLEALPQARLCISCQE